ncbi:hypothetical protein HDV57DRAFT_10435 [Trichoderma longibrachiatum]
MLCHRLLLCFPFISPEWILFAQAWPDKTHMTSKPGWRLGCSLSPNQRQARNKGTFQKLRVAWEPMNSKCCNRSFERQHCMITDYKEERCMPFEKAKEGVASNSSSTQCVLTRTSYTFAAAVVPQSATRPAPRSCPSWIESTIPKLGRVKVSPSCLSTWRTNVCQVGIMHFWSVKRPFAITIWETAVCLSKECPSGLHLMLLGCKRPPNGL